MVRFRPRPGAARVSASVPPAANRPRHKITVARLTPKLVGLNFQLSRDLVWQLVHVPLQRLVVPLKLPVGLRMVRRSEYAPDTDQLKVLPEQS